MELRDEHGLAIRDLVSPQVLKDGAPVPLTATQTNGRQWNAMNQAEVLDYARSLIAPHEKCTDSFIRAHIECGDTRSERTEHLAKNAQTFDWDSVKILN